ncbi:MAG: hypothetical protein ACT4OI_10745 [Methanobacteriota archaeon]
MTSQLNERLDRLRSFVWWTAPLYVLFVLAGLYASDFALTVEFGILVALLAAFASLDGMALLEIRGIASRLLSTEDLDASRHRIERLSRFLTWGGAAFAVLFLLVFMMRMLTRPA